MRTQAQPQPATVWPGARRERLEDSFSTISTGGVMRHYQTGGEAGPEGVVPASAGQAQPDGGQVGSQTAGDMVPVLRSVFEGLVNPNDPGNIRNQLKTYRELEDGGYISLAKAARGKNISGHKLAAAMEAQEWVLDPPAAAEPPPQDPPYNPYAQPGAGGPVATQPIYDPATNQYIDPYSGQPIAGGGAGGSYLTPEQAEARMDERFEKFKTDLQATATETQQKADRDQLGRDRMYEADHAMAKGLKAIGIERKPKKDTFYGAEVEEQDWRYDHELVPQVNHLADTLWKRDIHPDDAAALRDYDELSPPAKYVSLAIQGLESRLKAQQLNAAAAGADNQLQTGLPEGALPAGAGGDPKKDFASMTPDERRDAIIARRKAKGDIFEE